MQSTATPKPRLLCFAGSQRAASHNKKLAKLAAALAEADGIAATFADLKDYELPLYDQDVQTKDGIPANTLKFEALMRDHSGVFIACPEYNASITPLLKNTLDWLSRIRDPEPLYVFKTRAFALGCASPGGMGGLRGVNTVRTVLELGLGALVLPDQFAVPKAMDAFDEAGGLKNKDSEAQLRSLLGKLARTGAFVASTDVAAT